MRKNLIAMMTSRQRRLIQTFALITIVFGIALLVQLGRDVYLSRELSLQENQKAELLPYYPLLGKELVDASERSFQIATLSHSRVLVNVWAKWCGACVAELSSLAKLLQSSQGAQVGVVLIELTQNGGGDQPDPVEIAQFKKEERYRQQVFLVQDIGNVIDESIPIDKIPTTIAIQDGKILSVQTEQIDFQLSFASLFKAER